MTTYYIGKTNASDSYSTAQAQNPGTPWTTLSKFNTTGAAGDTLRVLDGTYSDAFANLRAGTAGGYTTYRANTDGGAIFTGGFNIAANYIQSEGLKYQDSNEKGITGNHVKVLRTAFRGGPSSGNQVTVLVNGTSNVLLEDCWAYGGGGRYKFLVYACDSVLLRRCIARHDGGWTYDGSNPQAGLQTYASTNVHLHNCLSIDPLTGLSAPLGNITCTYHNGQHATGNNTWVGCMVINGAALEHLFTGDIESGGQSGTQTITDFVGIGASSGGWGFTAGSDYGTFSFNRIALKTGTGGMGRWGSASVAVINAIVKGFTSDDFDGISPTYFDTYGNGASQTGTGRVTYDPQTNGWLYPVRIEAGSALKTAGSSGGQIGPQILTKIGVSGTLYGDTGWNTDTGEALWPFPNEDRIKTDMAAISTRGFCAPGNALDGNPLTLTRYIWEYLGNAMPSGIYNAGGPPSGLITLNVE